MTHLSFTSLILFEMTFNTSLCKTFHCRSTYILKICKKSPQILLSLTHTQTPVTHISFFKSHWWRTMSKINKSYLLKKNRPPFYFMFTSKYLVKKFHEIQTISIIRGYIWEYSEDFVGNIDKVTDGVGQFKEKF